MPFSASWGLSCQARSHTFQKMVDFLKNNFDRFFFSFYGVRTLPGSSSSSSIISQIDIFVRQKRQKNDVNEVMREWDRSRVNPCHLSPVSFEFAFRNPRVGLPEN